MSGVEDVVAAGPGAGALGADADRQTAGNRSINKSESGFKTKDLFINIPLQR
jgi:hypothetical protein